MSLQHAQSTSTVSETLDPNIAQRAASSPHHSVWVSASAGTGKTKVLTDRVLRLLLPDNTPEGRQGSDPSRILCLTFTNAAATEMTMRIMDKLAQWAVIDEDKLVKELEKLSGETPHSRQINAARQLFAKTVDTPGGMKIMTIHAFCQSLLGRFPIETGLNGSFSLLSDAQLSSLRQMAYTHTLQDASCANAIHLLAETTDISKFSELLHNSANFFNKNIDDFAADKITPTAQKIACELGVSEDTTQDDINSAFRQKLIRDTELLRIMMDKFFEYGGAKVIESAEHLAAFLEDPQDAPLDTALSAFLTKKKEPRKFTDKFKRENTDIVNHIETFTGLCVDYLDECRAILSLNATKALLQTSSVYLYEYERLKRDLNGFDYDDLIAKSVDLLTRRVSSQWVLYKLDGGLDHILVDEAQDTNPSQWQIIQALTGEEFFAYDPSDHPDKRKTIFVVGDDKQSIYKFQGADIQTFYAAENYYSEMLQLSGQELTKVIMNTSFRSSPIILSAVNALLQNEDYRCHVTKQHAHQVVHHAFNQDMSGQIELWPVFAEKEKSTLERWSSPFEITDTNNPKTQLVREIAAKIRHMLDNNYPVYDRDSGSYRPATPGDIMILVRKRSGIYDDIAKTLHQFNIPVSGNDRIVLKNEMVIQDLLALLKVITLPDDDLNLAGFLKSPLIGLTDDDLIKLSPLRSGTLWSALKDHPDYQQIANWLGALIRDRLSDNVYDLMVEILEKPCPASTKSGLIAITTRLGHDCKDTIEEFLNQCLNATMDGYLTPQSFLSWFQKVDSDIKRQLSESAEEVRIMTIHGSKGLEAPIIIMPDALMATRDFNSKDSLLWIGDKDAGFPLWYINKDAAPQAALDQKAIEDGLATSESMRLLYVAMTRAREKLIICSHKPHGANILSWYNQIKTAMSGISDTQTATFDPADPQVACEEDEPQTLILRSKTHALAESRLEAAKQATTTLPDWIYKPAPEEPTPSKPLTPSRPSQSDPATLSPLQENETTRRFLRGNITHQLIQFLPDCPEHLREARARVFLERYNNQLSDNVRASILDEVLAILNSTEFSPLFGENSIAEVPVSGQVSSHTVISGQIDRLAFVDNEIWIVDYKSNRPSPQNVADVPAVYRTQLSHYAAALGKIHPEKHIRTFLLWTDAPRLMEIRL